VREGKELLVGTVIIASVVVLVTGTLWLKGTNWGRPVTQVEVWVRDIGQLMQGNQVVFRGVPIGQVASIAVDEGGEFVRVGLELEEVREMPPDARAIVSPESLFGDWQLEVVTRTRFPRFDYYEVEEGYTTDAGVRVLGGYALPDISRLTAAADEISENLAVLTDRFDRAFNEETADALSQAIRNVQQVSDDIKNLIQQQASTFQSVSVQVEGAATEIGSAAVAARSTLERVDALMARGEIDSILVAMRDASGSLRTIAENVDSSSGDLSGLLARADSTVATFEMVARRLAGGEGALGRLLVDTTFAFRAEAAMAQLELLLQDIRLNPGRYVRLSIF